MGDVEDVEIYAAEPIYQWQQTPEGKFCMEKATDIHWVTTPNPHIYGHTIKIIGTLEDKYATFWALKRT
jgi:arginine exporter protein ArgO